MKGLFIKDLRLILKQKKSIITVIIFAIMLSFIFKSFQFMISYLIFLSMLYVIGTMSYDEFDNGMNYLLALPISKKDYVSSKYLLALSLSLLVALFAIILSIIIGFFNTNIEILDSIISIFSTFAISLLAIDIVLPINIKYGIEKGRIAMVLSIGAIFMIGWAIILFIKELFDINILITLLENNLILAFVIAIFIIVLITLISYKTSINIFKKKEY